jgi:hypothetical protein
MAFTLLPPIAGEGGDGEQFRGVPPHLNPPPLGGGDVVKISTKGEGRSGHVTASDQRTAVCGTAV